VLVAACATTPRVDPTTVESAIHAINRQMEQAVASKNVDAIVNLYATDAVFMPPNTPALRGHAAIRGNWAEAVGLPNASLRLTPTRIDVAASGDLATDVGTYTFSFNGDQGPVNDRGKYMAKFIKVGTDWKIASDIYNSDVPVATPQPAPVTVVVIEPTGDDMVMNAAAGLSFQPIEVPGFKSGMQIAVVHGDPMGKGDYTIRLKFPAGYMFPAHYHPNAEHLTVLSGSFQLAMGEKEGGTLHDYKPGDFLYIPGKKPHYGGAKSETVIQLHGIGPFEIKLAGVAE
jgi:ketosteroid isomerase-like protein/quercetin dioxygenase-like cupin family protein